MLIGTGMPLSSWLISGKGSLHGGQAQADSLTCEAYRCSHIWSSCIAHATTWE